jgi:3-(3-hydroxy-phenyl)propionate hydroxylase
MHQPTSQARPSIYYTYEVFKPWLASQHPAQKRQRVVIAGSGPAGMVTALELARHGVPSVVLTSELQLTKAVEPFVSRDVRWKSSNKWAWQIA